MDTQEHDILQRLLDYHLGQDEGETRRETQRLIEADATVGRLHRALQETLAPLAQWDEPAPPAGLVDRTLNYVTLHEQVRAGADVAEAEPVAAASGSGAGRARWVLGNLRDWLAIAACLLIAVGVLHPGLRHAREISRQHLCALQMGRMGTALSQYALDNKGYLPYVAHQPGATWADVGNQQAANHSNTRNPFLLVKEGYVPSAEFLCPAVPQDATMFLQVRPQMLPQLRDFESAEQLHYSYRLMFGSDGLRADGVSSTPIMADRNPLFSGVRGGDHPGKGQPTAGQRLNLLNSPNHGARRQNVLFVNGRVAVGADRQQGPGGDDIYTIESLLQYQGNETPHRREDIFIAP